MAKTIKKPAPKAKTVDSSSEYVKKLQKDIQTYKALQNEFAVQLNAGRTMREYDSLLQAEEHEEDQYGSNLLKENLEPEAVALNTLIRLKIIDQEQAEELLNDASGKPRKYIYSEINLYAESISIIDKYLNDIIKQEMPFAEGLEFLEGKLKEKFDELVEKEKLKY